MPRLEPVTRPARAMPFDHQMRKVAEDEAVLGWCQVSLLVCVADDVADGVDLFCGPGPHFIEVGKARARPIPFQFRFFERGPADHPNPCWRRSGGEHGHIFRHRHRDRKAQSDTIFAWVLDMRMIAAHLPVAPGLRPCRHSRGRGFPSFTATARA